MLNKYSINQLSDILGVTRTAVNRKVSKYNFNTVQEYVNGRPLKLIELTNEQLEALKSEVEFNKSDNTVSYVSHDTKQEIYNTNSTHENSSSDIDKILHHNEKMINQIRHFADTAIEQERQKVLLLETIEKNKDNEIAELRARVKQLESEITQSRTNKKWWNLGK